VNPVVRVVGLGPSTADHITERTARLIRESAIVRFRTVVHPSALHFGEVESYDEFYERANSFDELYDEIADDLVRLARESPGNEVLYVVPGSPVVAERTVELLRERGEVSVVTEPAVSVIDVACAALGRDPMSAGLRIVDALASAVNLRGPGPILLLQTYSPEILATVADRLPGSLEVTILHHLGLEDETIVTSRADELTNFASADHLTSLWINEFRDAGEAMSDLLDMMKRLRAECPWDQEQTHSSLTRYLIEEAYEALDALEAFASASVDGVPNEALVRHAEEELGDLLLQVVFHAELASEEGTFDFTSIADAVRQKNIGRHPHVFGDVKVANAEEVATRWEVIKQSEKGRASVTDGIAWQLPSLTLYTKLLRKAASVDMSSESGESARRRASEALAALELDREGAGDADSTSDVSRAWGDALSALVVAARYSGIDLESVLRERALLLRDAIRENEVAKLAE
jgi:tetrapyrrole methylase family protein / MazG family protein